MERKRSMEATDWRDDIRKYKEEVLLRREEDLASFQSQLAELDKVRLQEAADFEKRELERKDSIRNSKLENEIQALKVVRNLLQVKFFLVKKQCIALG